MLGKKKMTMFLLAVLCMTFILTNSAFAANTHSLSPSAENMLGGGRCSDFASGFTIGMGIATVFGCAWCPIGALAAKVLSAYAC